MKKYPRAARTYDLSANPNSRIHRSRDLTALILVVGSRNVYTLLFEASMFRSYPTTESHTHDGRLERRVPCRHNTI